MWRKHSSFSGTKKFWYFEQCFTALNQTQNDTTKSKSKSHEIYTEKDKVFHVNRQIWHVTSANVTTLITLSLLANTKRDNFINYVLFCQIYLKNCVKMNLNLLLISIVTVVVHCKPAVCTTLHDGLVCGGL